MARSARPAPPVGRAASAVAMWAAVAAVACWWLVVATLPALRLAVASPGVARWSDVTSFILLHVTAWLPLAWGVRAVVAGALAVGFLVWASFARFRDAAAAQGVPPGVVSLACAGAATGVALVRPVVAAGLRGAVPLAHAALAVAIWWCAELIEATARGRDRRPRAWIAAFGAMVGALVGAPLFLVCAVAWPVLRLVPVLRARGLVRLFSLGLGLTVLLEVVVYLAVHGSGVASIREGAPGLRGLATFGRTVADGLGIVGCLLALVGGWSLLRAHQERALSAALVVLALVFVPGDAAWGSRAVVALAALAVPVAAGITATARAFGRAALPAAFVLAFMCAVWPALDGFGPVVAGHTFRTSSSSSR